MRALISTLMAATAAVTVTGCDKNHTYLEEASAAVEPASSIGMLATQVDFSPQVETGAAEQFQREQLQRWSIVADTKVKLAGQRARKFRLAELLAMSNVDKERFMRSIESEGMRPGRSLTMQLQMFDAFQSRIANELDESDKLVSRLELSVSRIAQEANKQIFKEVTMNQDRPVSEFSLTESQVHSLAKLKIRTARDFVLQFYLPEQHELLASLLQMDISEATALVDQVSSEVPAEELQLLAKQTREPKSLGALPPEQEK